MHVYVIGPGGHDYSPAEKYGPLTRIGDKRNNPFDTDALAYLAKQELLYATKDDALLPGGNAVLNCIAAAEWYRRQGCLNILVYGAKQRDYVLRTVHL